MGRRSTREQQTNRVKLLALRKSMSPLNLYRAMLCEEECGTGKTESSVSLLTRMLSRDCAASIRSNAMLQEKQEESSSTRILQEYKTLISELRKTHTFATAAALNQMAVKHMSEKSYTVGRSKNNEERIKNKERFELAHLTCPSKHETSNPTFTAESKTTMHNLLSAGGGRLKQVLHKASFQFQEPQNEHKQKLSSEPLCIILKCESRCDLAKLNKNSPCKEICNVVDATNAKFEGEGGLRRIISVVSFNNIAEHTPMDSDGSFQSEEYTGDSLICTWRTNSELAITEMVSTGKQCDDSLGNMGRMKKVTSKISLHLTFDEKAETNTPLTGTLICEWDDIQPESPQKQKGESSSNVAQEQSIHSVLSLSNIHQLETGNACFLPDCSDESSVGLDIDV